MNVPLYPLDIETALCANAGSRSGRRLAPETLALISLRERLYEMATTSPPILPIASPAQLLPLLRNFVASSVPTNREPIAPSSRSLLRQISATAPNRPLSEHSINVLSDICHSIGEVATTAASGQGMQVLENFLGEEDAKNVESFWAEEWICE